MGNEFFKDMGLIGGGRSTTPSEATKFKITQTDEGDVIGGGGRQPEQKSTPVITAAFSRREPWLVDVVPGAIGARRVF